MATTVEKARQSRTVPRIQDYALIGDAHGAALVDRSGSIDWCCLPHIDTPPCLLRILDADRGGFFQLGAARGAASSRRYLPDTNVLETTLRTPTGTAVVLDAFEVGAHRTHLVGDRPARRHRILRTISCVAGSVDVELACRVTPDFARSVASATPAADGRAVTWSWEGGQVTLTSSVPLRAGKDAAVGAATLQAGGGMAAVFGDPLVDGASYDDISARMTRAVRYWRSWAGRTRYDGAYRDAVVRSALALKLLTHEPTGAIVAAPTSSLPESLGGTRNWDYRYCWLRDATFTLHALELVGHFDEAHAFMHWIERVWEAGPELQIMYGVNGESNLDESLLPHLRGYRDSRPVRVGNAAHGQRQLDVFGEVVDSAFLFFDQLHGAGRFGEALTGEPWILLQSLVDYVAAHWREPDHGIWEVRGAPRQFLHSKLLAWVALDRGIQLAETYHLPADVSAWRRERGRVRQLILERGYAPKLRAFTQTVDGASLDASLLTIPVVGFLPGDDPRVQSTVAAIQAGLGEAGGLLRRYETPDALAGTEGAFLVCSFWLVNALVLGGRVEEGRQLFEALLERANDVGLFAEEVDPASGDFLGNFPQGFTHIALIRSALFLEAAQGGAARPDPACPLPGRADEQSTP